MIDCKECLLVCYEIGVAELMKILHLNTFDSRSGAARAAYRIHTALRNSGLVSSAMLVAHKDSCDPDVSAYPVRQQWRKLRLSQSLLSYQRSDNPTYHSCNIFPSGIYKVINKSDADIVHFHWIGNELISIAEVKKIKKPIVWTLHDMWAFCGAEHCHDLFYPGRYKELYNKSNRPLSHKGIVDVDAWVWRRKKKNWQNVDFHFVTPSRWLADCVEESALFSGIRPIVIPNCLDTTVFRPKEKAACRRVFNLPQDKFLVLFGADGGVNNPLKGYSILKEALGMLGTMPFAGKMECVVFGGKNGGQRNSSTIPVSNVGHISNDDRLADLYCAADLFITPSMIEAFGQTVSEAMSCGTPCMGFRTSGIPELIEHQETGYLIEPYDAARLAEKIRWVVENPSQQIRIGPQARKKIQSDCSLSIIAGQYIAVYEKTLEG